MLRGLVCSILWSAIPRPPAETTTTGYQLAEAAPETMTETPPSFAGTPDRAAPAMGPDALSEMLRAVRLTGSV
jgi:hypothetical protein